MTEPAYFMGHRVEFTYPYAPNPPLLTRIDSPDGTYCLVMVRASEKPVGAKVVVTFDDFREALTGGGKPK